MKSIYLKTILSTFTAGAILLGCSSTSMNQTYKNQMPITTVEKVASYETGVEGGTEIVAFDEVSKKMFTTNGVKNSLDISVMQYDKENNKTSLVLLKSIVLDSYGASVNSVAVKNKKVAVALANKDINNKRQKGVVVIFDLEGNHLQTVKAGYLPDMVTFNEDGSKIIVANEAEPNKDYSHDPKGSIGIIDSNTYSYKDLTFDGVFIPKDVVIKNNTKASYDLEPEYITVKDDKAYVSLQENNAIAIVDIKDEKIERVVALGFKDHSKSENSLDIEENGKIELKTYKNLFGMYQPDSIASFKVKNKTYLVTANEGDGREYDTYENETKIKKLKLDSSIKDIYKTDNDLKINNELGLEDGVYKKLYTFGARSFSIWDENGLLVFDSKNELAKLAIKNEKELFNHDEGEMDGRSGNKGVEPEALTVGEINGKTYAFIGLERQSAIVIYDITTPSKAKFVKYINTKDKDISPEGMYFVKKENSPTNNALLLVAFEVSGSTAVYEIK